MPPRGTGVEATSQTSKSGRHHKALDPLREPGPTPTREMADGLEGVRGSSGIDSPGCDSVGEGLPEKGRGVCWEGGRMPKALEPQASFAHISVPTLSSPPLSFARSRTPPLTALRTMTMGHIPRHSLDTSKILHTWSLDTGWYISVIMSHIHTMANLREDTLRSPHPYTAPAPHCTQARLCTYTHAPGHTWPHKQVHSAPCFSCLLPSRVRLCRGEAALSKIT